MVKDIPPAPNLLLPLTPLALPTRPRHQGASRPQTQQAMYLVILINVCFPSGRYVPVGQRGYYMFVE